ncbi:hypothetical protein SmJEL517_g06243 [Synchytrium microbalum]|uniref:Eukaryotic translation initiation factor 3 subunit A n=1 Tax=Synchytrium microbalum TaxID=1806994 RepID=A0A507BRT0_9FUNG|nr:uncharacterized protein SmJEL517_g06243 [Synchytrium microbalum]TPX30121.1 hypothetical protein SmJEL517_g06243 [Synchytrium microbalum]
MGSRYVTQKPENALKRAEELIAVGQNGSALQLLHEIVLSRRSRSTAIASLEPIMLKFIELCVQMRKGKTAKEGLHQYKNIQQNNNITTIEVVIKKFIDLSEQKVADAQAKADKIALDSIDDLEATETPESIILSTVSGEASKDRTDREVVTPWLKFLWEAYRTALDILRNNARLETLYQIVATQAFGFCLKYTRKTEFRRLCDLLRQHLATAAKYAHQPHSINLSDPDTLQRHLDTRFIQLSAATDLELWQEGFRSIEDIYNLLSMSKKAPRSFMMANYYEKLARILLVGENYLFHAAAWNRYYAIARQNRNLSEDEHDRMASMVLLSALSIPIIQTGRSKGGSEEAENKEKAQRLANLLRAPRPPTREILLRDALAKTVLARVKPELRELYDILEVQFHPLSICKKIAPIMQQLQANPDFAKYVRPIHQIILTRLLQQLSQVYTTIKIESVLKLAAFPEPYNLDIHKIEKFIMNGCKKGELSIRIDHRNKSLTFESDLFMTSKSTGVDGPKLSTLSSTQTMGIQLAQLAKRLHTAVLLVDPSKADAAKKAKAAAFATAIASAEEEHQETFKRRALIERKKELREAEIARKVEEEQRLKKLKIEKEQQAEKQRLEEESRRREIERVAQQKATLEKEEARKLAEKMAEDLTKRKIKVDKEELEGLDADKLMALQVKQLEQERRDLQARLKILARRNDFVERAFRKEEIPLLLKDFEEQKEAEKTFQDALREATIEAARKKHTEAMQVKERMMRMLPDYREYRSKLEVKRNEEYHKLEQEAAKQIAAAKEKRKADYIKRKEEDRRRAEEEERIAAEEAEARRKMEEEEEFLENKRQEELAVRKAEEAERMRKLDEQAAKQREREKAAEDKLAGRITATSTPGTKYVPPAAAASTGAAASKWIPGVARTASAAPATPTPGAAWAPKAGTGAAPSAGGGGWRDRVAANAGQAMERSASSPTASPIEPTGSTPYSSSTYTPPSARAGPPMDRGGSTESGWRVRAAQKEAGGEGGERPSPFGAAKPAGVWTPPSRSTSGGAAPEQKPASTPSSTAWRPKSGGGN